MKRLFTILASTFALIFIACSCRTEEPDYIYKDVKSFILEEGNYVIIEIDFEDSNLRYATSSQDSICKVIPAYKDGTRAIIYALHPGLDTITVTGSYQGIATTFPIHKTIYVEVMEKPTTTD